VTRTSLAIGVIVFAVLLVMPQLVGVGPLNMLVKAMIAVVFAMAFNLLWGEAGLLSFGHAAYLGIGAFAAIFMMQAIEKGFPFPTPLVPLCGALAGLVIGLFVGWFSTILGGLSFAMVTVALAELIHSIAERWALLGGDAGLRSVREPWGPIGFQTLPEVYYFTLVWTLIVLAGLWCLRLSPLGLIIRGIREREERTSFLGYNVHLTKTFVFSMSAAISGLAGGLLAFTDETVNTSLFSSAGSATVVLNTVIGGAGVFLGPAIGAVLMSLYTFFIPNLTHYSLLYLGLIFITVVMSAPRGLTGISLHVLLDWREPRQTLRLFGMFGGIALIVIATVLAVEIVGTINTPEY